MKKNILLTPGPTPVPEAVRKVLAEPIIHHRTPQYRKVFASACEKLKKVFLTANPVYTLTGSGTSAMEAAIVNFHSPGDKVLVAEAGKFGERFTEIAQAYGLTPIVVKVPYGEAVPPQKIKETLEKNPDIRSVCVELCETSTAILHDIKAIGEIVAKTDALLIVDAVSGLGADRLETDKWNVDLAVAGSQKALMLPPGLAFLSVSAKAQKRMASAKLQRYYLDLRYYEKAIKNADTPFTPAVGLVLAMDVALSMIEKEGLENVFKRCGENAVFTREKLRGIGLELFSKAPSSTASAAKVPEGIDGEKLIKIMRDDKGVSMAGGQGSMKGQIVRICHMGAITRQDIQAGIDVLQETLHEMSVGTSKS